MELSKRLKNFPEYIFSILAKKVKKIEKETGKKVLNLGIGNPTYPPSKIYIQKLKRLYEMKDAHLYPGYGPMVEFRDAVINWYKKRFKVKGISENEVYQLHGGKDGISHLSPALFDQGDEVLVPDPGYAAFSGSALLVNAKPVFYDLIQKNNFKINFNELKTKVSKKTKAIWVNFPSNPTGQVATKNDLQKLVSFAEEFKIWILYDNPYSEITFGDFQAPSILEIPKAKNFAVELNSFSKTFSFAGFRMAWIVGNYRIIHALAKIKSQIDSGMSKSLQRLGAFVLNNFDNDWYEKMIKTYENRGRIIINYLKKIGLECEFPKASLYIWTKIPSNFENSEKFCMHILERKQVLLTPGTAFGKNGKNFVRASICSNIDKIDDYF